MVTKNGERGTAAMLFQKEDVAASSHAHSLYREVGQLLHYGIEDENQESSEFSIHEALQREPLPFYSSPLLFY